MKANEMNIPTLATALRNCAANKCTVYCPARPIKDDCCGYLMRAAADKLDQLNNLLNTEATRTIEKVNLLEVENGLLKDALRKGSAE